MKPCRLVLALMIAGLSSAAYPAAEALWQFDAMVDLGYAKSLHDDAQLMWRSKATTQRLNRFAPNMGMFIVRKVVDESSPWGIEIGAQAGYDTDGQVPAEQRLPGYSMLRYLSRANVSYRLPIGTGLTLTAGLMNSFIGYESMFAKDNPNYTRSWIADYSPYYLLGAGGQYSVNEQLALGFYLLSDYDYLAYRSGQPKYAGQWVWNFDSKWKLTHNLFAGPEQESTDTRYWRYFADTILQWTDEALSLAVAYDVGTEKLNNAQDKQSLWMGAALFARWHVAGPWSLGLRPEIYWDGDGRMTGNRQLIKAVTATLEYKLDWKPVAVSLRSEYRYDDATGSQGGFFRSNDPNAPLIGDQHLLLFSCLLSFNR